MIVHLIASPRNVSTALMYSMGQHPEIFPVDEPFYAAYLAQSGADHPDRALIMKNQPTDRMDVFTQIAELESRYPVVFLKNMAHHIIAEDLDKMKNWRHCFLIRHPKLHINSFAKVIRYPNLEALGTTTQRKWYDILKGKNALLHLIDANQLLENPSTQLQNLCRHIGIDFYPGMLTWPSGPKSFDGCWAPHWYKRAWASTRFGTPVDPHAVDLPEDLYPLYKECMVDYQYLYSRINS